MKTFSLGFGLILIGFLSGPVFAQSIGLDIHIGNQPRAPIVAGPPAFALETPPDMVYVNGIGAYVAVGIPQDLFFYHNAYFYYDRGLWYRSAYYGGPWYHTEGRGIPPGFHGRRIEELREYKRHAWDDHRDPKMRSRERHFRAEGHDERHVREYR